MDKINLSSTNFNYIKKNQGFESNIYKYDDTHYMKIFKTENQEVLDNKLKKSILLSELDTDDVIPTALIYIDDIFKGYLSEIKNEYIPLNAFKQSKKQKYIILKQVLEKLKEMHEIGMYYGDLHENNILTNGSDIILCDLDNSYIDGLDFDVKNCYQIAYLLDNKVSKGIDSYMFNMFTISYLYKIAYVYTYANLKKNGFYQGLFNLELNTKLNNVILKKMIHNQELTEDDVFINNIKRRILF